jgi:hypothetical protein
MVYSFHSYSPTSIWLGQTRPSPAMFAPGFWGSAGAASMLHMPGPEYSCSADYPTVLRELIALRAEVAALRLYMADMNSNVLGELRSDEHDRAVFQTTVKSLGESVATVQLCNRTMQSHADKISNAAQIGATVANVLAEAQAKLSASVDEMRLSRAVHSSGVKGSDTDGALPESIRNIAARLEKVEKLVTQGSTSVRDMSERVGAFAKVPEEMLERHEALLASHEALLASHEALLARANATSADVRVLRDVSTELTSAMDSFRKVLLPLPDALRMALDRSAPSVMPAA